MQPRRLALIAYLALASRRGFHRRDTLLGLFWPETDEERARHALRQALHSLRRALGPEVIVTRGDDEVGIDTSALWCDATAFENAMDAGDFEAAIALYRGDLLPGFFVSNASPEFEHWIDHERSRLRALAATAAWTLATAAEAHRDGVAAAAWARRATELSPDDEASHRRLIGLLDRRGDRAGALRAHAEFARHLAAELDVEPSAETKSLIDAIRARECSHPNGVADGEAAAEERPAPDPRFAEFLPPRQAIPDGQTRLSVGRLLAASRRTFIAGSTVVAALLIVGFGYRISRDGTENSMLSAPVVAIGTIVERGKSSGDTNDDAGTLRDLLATDLSRVSGLNVVSQARLYDILGQMGTSDETRASVATAARRAGATEVLEGVLYRRESTSSPFRLDLRRLDLRSGRVTGAYTAQGSDLFSLVDSVTSQFAVTLNLRRPARTLGGVTSTSLVARRLYEEGMRWYYRDDRGAAARFFLAALDEDSTFGMAAYYAFLAGNAVEKRRVLPLLSRAARNTAAASERERLLLRHAWASASDDPSRLAYAESLATRFPNEPEGERAWGAALVVAGDFLGAVPHLRRAISHDSLSFSRPEGSALCGACEAIASLTNAYVLADSLASAERATREWMRIRPLSAAARLALAEVLARQGRHDEAVAQESDAARISPALARESWLDVRLALKAGDFGETDRLLAIRSRDVDPEMKAEALWWRIISLRYQGRLADARTAVDKFCRMSAVQENPREPSPACALARAPVFHESGRYAEAARVYDSMSIGRGEDRIDALIGETGHSARRRSWMLTHAGTAHAAAGAWENVARLADSVEKWGRLSSYGRDPRLHFHLRGLIAARAGRHADAASFFRRSIYSLSDGYTRSNLELARELIAIGRAGEAIGVLKPALYGPIQASNLYQTQTEIHEMMAMAYEHAGRSDSAAVHYQHVADAWQNGDPPFRKRALVARSKAGATR